MKITHKQLRKIIKEELSLPYDKATVFDVWKKGPWVSAHGGQSRGPADGEPLGRIRVSRPQHASELMHTLGQHGFDAGKIKPIYDNDGDNVVDWDEFIQLISDLSSQAEEVPAETDTLKGLGGETYEKTVSDYKKHPEWFNENKKMKITKETKMKITRRQLRKLIESTLSEQNPGSHFAAAQTKRAKKPSEKELKAKWRKQLQKTYDWFVDEVFPAMEAGKLPITTRERYVFHLYGQGYGGKTKLSLGPSFDMAVFFIPAGTSINTTGEIKSMVRSGPKNPGPRPFPLTLEEIWDKLESIGADPDLDLNVVMSSDAGEALDNPETKARATGYTAPNIS